MTPWRVALWKIVRSGSSLRLPARKRIGPRPHSARKLNAHIASVGPLSNNCWENSATTVVVTTRLYQACFPSNYLTRGHLVMRVCVQPGHHRRSGGNAWRTGAVGLLKQHSVLSKAVYVRCYSGRIPVTSDIPRSNHVSTDEYDVWSCHSFVLDFCPTNYIYGFLL